MIQVEELNGTNCKTYLLWSGKEAVLVDPVRERVSSYRRTLAEKGLVLRYLLETHMHADHLMLDRGLASSMGTEIVMHENSPSPLVGRHVRDGDELSLGDTRIQVLHTPGHTPDSVCYVVDGTVFTGDTLLIGGSGRTDFPGGDAGAQFDAIVEKLFVLPDETRVLPAHDYKGQKESSILREKSENPRLAGVSRDQYIDIMANLNLPLPDNVQHSLQVNQSGFEPNEVSFASVAEVATTEEVDAHDLTGFMLRADQLVLIDVREPEEFV